MTIQTPLYIDAIKLEASICRDSFKDFVQRFWSVAEPAALIWNWHMDVICDELQTAAERVFKGEDKKHDLIINVPPGTSKSLLASVFFPAWVWTKMPTCKTICSSYTHTLALDLSRKSRDVVLSEKWQTLFGNVEMREDQNAKGHFMNSLGGYRYAVGTDGTVQGMHGHIIVIDDPLNPEQAVSDAERLSGNRWVSHTLEGRKVNKRVSIIILVMQRLHQGDPTAEMLDKASEDDPVRHICLPAEIKGNGRKTVRPRILSSRYVDGLLDPIRMPRKVLRRMRKRMSDYAYAGQFLQTPIPPGGAMFKVDRITIETPPNPIDMVRVCRFWDKAGTKGGGAYTAGVLIGVDSKGRFWVLDVVRGQWDSAIRERVIKQTAETDRLTYEKRLEIGIEQEPGSGGKESAQSTLRNLAGYRVRIDRPTGDKETRADPFSVQVNGENVYMTRAPWNRDYIEELRFFPNGTYKDQVDASSGAFTIVTRPRNRIGGAWRTRSQRHVKQR